MSEIREVRPDASNLTATGCIGGRGTAGNSDPKDRICVSSSTTGKLAYGYERCARLVNFGMGMTRLSERLAAVERRCQDNARIKAGKYGSPDPFCKTDMRKFD